MTWYRPGRMLRKVAPAVASAPLAPHHLDLWEWAGRLEPGTRSRPFVGVWPRCGGATSTAMLAVAALGGAGARRSCLWVDRTQAEADANGLDLQEIARLDWPELGAIAVTPVGLDAVEKARAAGRHDLIVLNDIDRAHDSPGTARNAAALIRHHVITLGTADVAVLMLGAMRHPHSVAAIVTTPEQFDPDDQLLRNRRLSGPIPAVYDLEVDEDPDGGWRITNGQAAWAGFDLARCQDALTMGGLTAFKHEFQHEWTTTEMEAQ